MWMFDLDLFGIIYLSVTGALSALLLLALFVFLLKKKPRSGGTVLFRVLDCLLLLVGLVACFVCVLANMAVFGLTVENASGTLNLLAGGDLLFGLPFVGGLAAIMKTYIGMGLVGLVTLLALIDIIVAGVTRKKQKKVDLVGMVDELPDSDAIEAEQLLYEEKKSEIKKEEIFIPQPKYEYTVQYGLPGDDDTEDGLELTMADMRIESVGGSKPYVGSVFYSLPGDESDDVYDTVADICEPSDEVITVAKKPRPAPKPASKPAAAEKVKAPEPEKVKQAKAVAEQPAPEKVETTNYARRSVPLKRSGITSRTNVSSVFKEYLGGISEEERKRLENSISVIHTDGGEPKKFPTPKKSASKTSKK